jgi:hypothetical protein
MKWKVALFTLMACVSLALTPAEREWAIEARTYVQAAKQKAHEQQKVIEESNRENEILDALAQGQRTQIETLSGQVDRSHNNEIELAKYNAYAKPIVEQVNKWCGLGAFSYGIHRLSKCFMWGLFGVVGVVVIVLVIGLLTGTFPAIVGFFKTAWGFVVALFRRIMGIFRKK